MTKIPACVIHRCPECGWETEPRPKRRLGCVCVECDGMPDMEEIPQ